MMMQYKRKYKVQPWRRHYDWMSDKYYGYAEGEYRVAHFVDNPVRFYSTYSRFDWEISQRGWNIGVCGFMYSRGTGANVHRMTGA